MRNKHDLPKFWEVKQEIFVSSFSFLPGREKGNLNFIPIGKLLGR